MPTDQSVSLSFGTQYSLPCSDNYSLNKPQILHQLTARAIIRDWDEGSLDSDRTRHEAVKRERKDYIISLSKQHKIVTKFTSFVAVETREKVQQLVNEH